jgi:MFS family permease
MSSALTAAVPLARDARVIGVVAVAHGTSHFFHLLLPPLFPEFIREFGLSYSELGLLVSLFFLVSSIGQALSGFLVDRVGARTVLYGALACFVMAALTAASAQGQGGLIAAALLAGLGNSPFHPVDFTILNKRVSTARIGHAFSVHGISGNLGWAAAPAFLIGLTTFSGSWRVACIGAALWALAVLVLVALHHEWLDDRAALRDDAPAGRGGAGAPAGAGGAKVSAAAAPADHPLAFLKLPTLWVCFIFFFCSTVALSAIQGFSAPALQRLYDLPLSAAASVLTGFMLAGAAGMIVGGFLLHRVPRLEWTIGVAMSGSAVLMLVVATGWLPGTMAAVVAALAGFGTGVAGPSRDMLIRQAAPPGATGRVYGTVYAGFDVGFTLGAPVFGWLLDHGHPSAVFAGAALAWLTGIAAASWVGLRTAARRPR